MTTTTGTDELWQLALAKWAEIAQNFPDLAPALALQQAMLRLLVDAREGLDDSAAPLPDTTPAAILEKWARGVPALRNETVLIPAPLVALLPAFCDALAQGGAGESAAHIGHALAAGEIDGGSLSACPWRGTARPSAPAPCTTDFHPTWSGSSANWAARRWRITARRDCWTRRS